MKPILIFFKPYAKKRFAIAFILAFSLIIYAAIDHWRTVNLPPKAIEALADIIVPLTSEHHFTPGTKFGWVCLINYYEMADYIGSGSHPFSSTYLRIFGGMSTCPKLREAVIKKLKKRYMVYDDVRQLPLNSFRRKRFIAPPDHIFSPFNHIFYEASCNNGSLLSYSVIQIDTNTIELTTADLVACMCSSGGSAVYRWDGEKWEMIQSKGGWIS